MVTYVAKKRYEAMLKKFKATKEAHEDNSGTKFCLSEREASLGMTIDEKLNSTCPGFFRLDAIFGGRQNITPASTFKPLDEGSDGGDYDDDEDEHDSAIDELNGIAAGQEGDSVLLDESTPASGRSSQASNVSVYSMKQGKDKSGSRVTPDNIDFSRQAIQRLANANGTVRLPSVSKSSVMKRGFNEIYAQTKADELHFRKEEEAVAKRNSDQAQAKGNLLVQLLQQGKSREKRRM